MANTQFLSHNIDLTDAIKDYAIKRIKSMNQLNDDDARIKLEIERKNPEQSKGEVYRVEAHIIYTGGEVYVDTTNEDLYAGIDELRDMVQSQLTKSSEQKRGNERKEGRAIKEQIQNL